MSKSIDKPTGTVTGTKEMMMFNPTTGEMEVCTISALANYITGGDVTAPTVVSCTCPNGAANTLVMVFSEAVTGVAVGDYSFKKNGSAWSDSSVSGSGTTWTFTMATSAVFGDTLLRSYSGTATIDGSSNPLAAFTDVAVTNSVAGTGLPHTSPFTDANGTAITAYVPTDGNAWVNEFGTMQIQSNRAVPLVPSSNACFATTDLEINEYTITMVFNRNTPSAHVIYILFRWTDINNFHYIVLGAGSSNVEHRKIVATVDTLISTTAVAAINNTSDHTAVLTVAATTCTLDIDASNVFTGNAIDAALTGTKAGIAGAGTGLSSTDITIDSFNAVA